MSATYGVEIEQATSSSDVNEASLELRKMQATASSHIDQTLEDIIDQCDSPNMNLLHQQLTDHDVSTITQLAIIKKKCIELKLGYNDITSQGIKMLADALNNNTTLERLNLFNNKVSDEGVHHLAQVLSLKNSNLKVLFLGQNQITDKGVEHLSEMLKTNQALIQLGLSNNEISDQGVILLANTLAYHNTTLKELYLWGNKLIGDDCIDALANMLVYNRSLNRLVLFDCNLSEASKTRLREIVESRINFGLFL